MSYEGLKIDWTESVHLRDQIICRRELYYETHGARLTLYGGKQILSSPFIHVLLL